MTLHNPAHAEHVLRHLEELRTGRVVEASELPSEEELAVVQAQLTMLVLRTNRSIKEKSPSPVPGKAALSEAQKAAQARNSVLGKRRRAEQAAPGFRERQLSEEELDQLFSKPEEP